MANDASVPYLPAYGNITKTLAGNGGSFAPPFAAVCSAIKWVLIAIAVLYALCGLVLWLRARRLQPSRVA
jgi:hypothetical protein